MNKLLNLSSWSNRNKVYIFNIEDGSFKKLISYNDEMKKTGVIKFFLFNKALAVYEVGDEWWVQYKKNKLKLKNKDFMLMVSGKGIFSRIKAYFKTEMFTFYDISLFPFLSQKLDPTFDALDLVAEDFFQWLYELRQGVRTADRGQKLE